MKVDEFEKFGQMLVAVGDLYGKTMGDMAIGIYFNALKEYDFAAVRQAFDRYVKNPDSGQFMPKPADLIRMMSGTSLDSAMDAWAKVDKAVRQIGPYHNVVFDDPLIHRAIADIGGWIALGSKTDDDWPFVARDFQNVYKGYAHRSETPEFDPVLTGLAEKAEPRLIGDTEKARQVMQSGTKQRLQVTALGDAVKRTLQISR